MSSRQTQSDQCRISICSWGFLLFFAEQGGLVRRCPIPLKLEYLNLRVERASRHPRRTGLGFQGQEQMKWLKVRVRLRVYCLSIHYNAKSLRNYTLHENNDSGWKKNRFRPCLLSNVSRNQSESLRCGKSYEHKNSHTPTPCEHTYST